MTKLQKLHPRPALGRLLAQGQWQGTVGLHWGHTGTSGWRSDECQGFCCTTPTLTQKNPLKSS